MPATLTYPGVYIQEVPSGVRTITGVATSITAFVGSAPRGLTNEPTVINSFGDFERAFGGLAADYPLTYAVRDFFQYGGGQAIVVRTFTPEKGKTVKVKVKKEDPPGKEKLEDQDIAASDDNKARFAVDTLKLCAISPGAWANDVEVVIDHKDPSKSVLEDLKLDAADLFNLTLSCGGVRESYRDLSVKEGPRRVDRVLKKSSSLVAVEDFSVLAARPKESPSVLDSKGNAKPLPYQVNEAGYDSTAVALPGSPDDKTGIYALDKADLFNLLCLPPTAYDTDGGETKNKVYADALSYCEKRRAMLIVDSPKDWDTVAKAKAGLDGLGLTGLSARNAAIYFPRVKRVDPLRRDEIGTFVPCGIIAGLMARNDAQRGVWKAPAGLDAAITGIDGFTVKLNDAENGELNPLGINCLRSFPVNGRVIWGARTLRGADGIADEYKYIPVRRLALFIEESLYRGTQWVVFEPNDEPLWAQIRLNVGAFMYNMFRQGAFQGASAKDAYFVRCDKETTTQNDINLGIVNILIGFAPLKPAEFVVIKLQQMAGQIQT